MFDCPKEADFLNFTPLLAYNIPSDIPLEEFSPSIKILLTFVINLLYFSIFPANEIDGFLILQRQEKLH